MSYADGSGGPIALRTSPLASGLPLTCEALPFAGGASAPYLPGCARQLFIVRCAHYARGASLSTFGFVTIVPRYLLPQVIPSHSFAALTALIVRRVNGLGDQPGPASVSSRAPPEGALARAPGGGTLPLNILGIMRNRPYTAENSPAAPAHTTSLSLSCKFFLTAFGVKALRRNTERNTFPSSVVTSIGSAPL